MQVQISATHEDSRFSKDHGRVLHQLLGEIEAVRIKRQETYRDKEHAQTKRFTQQELNDEVCPTYKNLLIGRSQRLPERAMLMTIADYLECTLSERNDLLLAAQYLPEQPIWEDSTSLQKALDQAQQIIETLPYPAIIITHTYQVQAANKFFLHLLDLPSLEALRPHQRSMMHLIFRFDYYKYTAITAEARASWQKHALFAIQHFKQQNVLYQHDTWYQQSVQQWHEELTGFREYWEKAETVTRQDFAPTKIVLARMAPDSVLLPIHVRHMLISVSSKPFPIVSALFPVDAAARAVYAAFASLDSSAS
jgi:hypothetical protein